MTLSVQQQYKIIEATIFADKLGSTEIDVRPSIAELVLYENLEKPYVTGQITIADNNGIFDSISFSGTERIRIHLASEETIAPATIPRTFVMTSIENVIKSSDAGSSSVYVFTLIDEHAILSKAKKISRTVQNNLETEIQKICTTDLKKNIDISYMFLAGDRNQKVSSIQSNFKGIIPYMHPLDACEWLRDRATTQTGSPFFLYASIHDENLRLGNLDVMLQEDPFNPKNPYIYSPSNVQRSEERSPIQKTFQIQNIRSAKMQNTFQQMTAGGIGSLYNNTNLNTGRISSSHFSIRNTLRDLKNNNTIPSEKIQNVFDENYLLDGEDLDEYNARIFHSITSTGTYGFFKSIHDETDITKFKKKIANISIRNMLYKNMMEVIVPGAGFLISQASVGDIIRINVISDIIDTETDSLKLDLLRSGDFLIYNVRHNFRDTRHDVAMTVCKITRG